MANENLPGNVELNQKLDKVLEKLDTLEQRLDTLEQGPYGELIGPLSLLHDAMTDDMVKGLVGRVSRLAEVGLDPQILELLGKLSNPELLTTLGKLTDPMMLEMFNGLASVMALMNSAITDEMVKGLMRKLAGLAELLTDPWVLDALQRVARALKTTQSEYPDVRVPSAGNVWSILRGANDPDSKRVATFSLTLLKKLGKEFS